MAYERRCVFQPLLRDTLAILKAQQERIKELEELLYKGGCDGLNACSVMSCPYYNASHVRIEETKAAIIVGLQTENEKLQAKIRELETTRDTRVMTLEEIDKIIYQSSNNYERLFWAESKSITKCSFGVFELDIETNGDYEALLIGCSWPVCYRRETYGVRWRCWTSRPTDKQREAVKWE